MNFVFGSNVHVVRRGLGSPTLLLHGNPDSSAMWAPLVDRLRERCDCIAPDLPGFGRTPVPARNEATLDWAADWVDGLVNELAIETPLDLVVHDVGGFVGLAWAVRFPHRVRRIVITNTIFQADYQWHFWARVWRRRGLGEFSMALLGLPLLGRALFAATLRLGGPGLSRAQIAEICDGFGPVTRAQVLHLYRATDPANFAGWEERLLVLAQTIPTRVIWGDRDPFIERRYAERFGTTDVHHLADVGHWPAAEAPDRMAALVLEHFAD
ncbi:MAG: alpha/beta hydrolase [Nevskia sp.]